MQEKHFQLIGIIVIASIIMFVIFYMEVLYPKKVREFVFKAYNTTFRDYNESIKPKLPYYHECENGNDTACEKFLDLAYHYQKAKESYLIFNDTMYMIHPFYLACKLNRTNCSLVLKKFDNATKYILQAYNESLLCSDLECCRCLSKFFYGLYEVQLDLYNITRAFSKNESISGKYVSKIKLKILNNTELGYKCSVLCPEEDFWFMSV